MEYRRRYSRYQTGTAAPKYNEPIRRPKKKVRVREYRKIEVSYREHPLTAQRRKTMVKICATAAVVFLMLTLVVAINGLSSKVSLQNVKIQENINDLQEQIEKINVDITTSCDIHTIAQDAEERLDMSFPSDDQVRYVVIDEDLPTEQSENIGQNN